MIDDDEKLASQVRAWKKDVDRRRWTTKQPLNGLGPNALGRLTAGALVINALMRYAHNDRHGCQCIAEELEKRNFIVAADAVSQLGEESQKQTIKRDATLSWTEMHILAHTLNRDLNSPGPRITDGYAPYETVEDLRMTGAPATVVKSYQELVANRYTSAELGTRQRHSQSDRRQNARRRQQTNGKKRTLRLS